MRPAAREAEHVPTPILPQSIAAVRQHSTNDILRERARARRLTDLLRASLFRLAQLEGMALMADITGVDIIAKADIVDDSVKQPIPQPGDRGTVFEMAPRTRG